MKLNGVDNADCTFRPEEGRHEQFPFPLFPDRNFVRQICCPGDFKKNTSSIFESNHPVCAVFDIKDRGLNQLRKFLVGLGGDSSRFRITHQIPCGVDCMDTHIDQGSSAGTRPIGEPSIYSAWSTARSHPHRFSEINL